MLVFAYEPLISDRPVPLKNGHRPVAGVEMHPRASREQLRWSL